MRLNRLRKKKRDWKVLKCLFEEFDDIMITVAIMATVVMGVALLLITYLS